GTNGEQDIAAPCGVQRALHRARRQILLEHHDVRPQKATAMRARRLAKWVGPISVARAIEAPRTAKRAVQLQDLLAPGAVMQSVDILGDEQKLRNPSFYLGDSMVRRVRLRLARDLRAFGVPTPCLGRPAAIAARVRELLDVGVRPERVLARAKRWNA